MATASAPSDSAAEVVAPANERECSVCHEPFCDPKLLPCGHVLCRQCLLTWVKSKRRAACPLCRWPIVQEEGASEASAVSSGGKGEGDGDGDNTEVDESKLQALVDSFPTDLTLAALEEAERMLNKKDHKCCMCDNVQATSLCLHCGDLLCGPCKNYHSRLSATRHHTIEDLSTLTADRLAERPTPCDQHPEEPCRFYCSSHATSLCLLCATSRHKGCSDVTELEQQAEEARKVLLELIKKLASGETDLDVAIAELEQHMAQVEQKTEAGLTEIRTLRDRLHKSVNDKCDNLGLKVSESRDKILEDVTLAKTILLGRKSRLGSHKTVAERSHDSKAREVVCGMTSVMKIRVKDLEHHVTLPDSAKVIAMATLLVDQSAVQRVEQELTKLGEVKLIHAKVAANVTLTIDPVQFHESHGKHVVMSNNNQTAERTQGNNHAVVVVSTPMKVNLLIEVHIDTWTSVSNCAYGDPPAPALGVLTQAPDSGVVASAHLSYIPKAICVYTGAVVISANHDRNHPMKEHVRNLGEGSRVGVCLDSAYNLHLYVNGQDKGIFASNVPQPCYAAFDVVDYTKKVTLLPPTQFL